MQSDRLGQELQRRWLDEVPDAVMLFDAQRHILWLNRRARALLEGSVLSAPAGLLTACSPRLVAALEAGMADLQAAKADRESSRVLRLPRPQGTLMLAFISLVHLEEAPSGPCFRLVVCEAGEAGAFRSRSCWCAASPSRRRKRVAVGLCEGLDVKALARREGNSVNTVRSQVRGVLEKTRTTRQVDLLRLLLSLPVRH